jgi:hypothetical protein
VDIHLFAFFTTYSSRGCHKFKIFKCSFRVQKLFDPITFSFQMTHATPAFKICAFPLEISCAPCHFAPLQYVMSIFQRGEEFWGHHCQKCVKGPCGGYPHHHLLEQHQLPNLLPPTLFLSLGDHHVALLHSPTRIDTH